MARKSSRGARHKLDGRQVLAALPVLIATAAAVVLVAQVSVAGEFRAKAPNIALTVMPFDADARARLAGALTANTPEAESREAANALARDAIRRDPITPIAFRALGQASSAEESAVTASSASLGTFNHAQRLSRRDQMTQLWLVNYYLQRREIPEMMRHIDITLRTSPSAEDTLFPLLAVASTDRTVADGLIARLRENPPWKLAFAESLQLPQVPGDTAVYVAERTLDPKVAKERAVIDALLGRLGSSDDYADAWQLYNRFKLGPRSSAGTLNDGNFETTAGVAPFGWILAEEADLWAARERREGSSGTLLRLVVDGERTGDLARQLVRLAPGAYRISAEFGDVPAQPFEWPRLSVTCAGESSTRLAEVRPTSGGTRARTVTQSFSVPAGCPFQWVTVSAAAQGTRTTDSPWIDNIAISPNR